MSTSFSRIASLSLISTALSVLEACGGGSSGGGGGGGGSGTAYTVGGMVTGLSGSGLVLRDNGGDDLTVAMSGSFTFATGVANGAAYSVTVYAQPINPAQTCVVSNGSGTMGTTNITNVAVACTNNAHTIGGTASGVAGTGLVLQDNSGDDLPVSMSGPFTFATRVAAGGAYSVTVLTQPSNPSQTCVVSNGSGTMGSGKVTNVAVNCGTNFSAATVIGAFVGVSYQISGDVGTLGTVTYDGAGGYSGTGVANVAGTIGAATPFSGTYTVATDGAFTGTSGAITTDGGVSADGRTLVLAQVSSGQMPNFAVDIQETQSGLTNADVSGTYRLVGYENAGTNGNLVTVVFDGAGNWSGSGTRNQSGTISNVTSNGTYTVAADGTITFSPAGGPALSGGVSADGNTLVLAQTTTGTPSTFVGIKQGQTNATNASFKGTYKLVNYDGSSNNAALLTLVADGAGNVAGTQILNAAGVISSSAISTTYTVAADGTVTVANGGGSPAILYLAADGNTLVGTDMVSGEFPVFSVGVRQ